MKKFVIAVLMILAIFNSNKAYSQVKGIYVWPVSFYEEGGVEKVINSLSQHGITDIFLLVKGEGGYSIYPSSYTYKEFYDNMPMDQRGKNFEERRIFMSDTTLLTQILNTAHAKKMKVHAWFIVSGDKNYVENNPGSEVVQIHKPDTTNYPYPAINRGNINLAYPPYKEYFFNGMKEALKYPFDGIMLDKIRYTTLLYSYDNIHISKAMRAGVDVEKIINCAVKTLYGTTDDKNLFFQKYRDGDTDICKWIEIKKEDIIDYTIESRKLCREKNIPLSASFMPEGAYDVDFADVHYAQNYEELSEYYDFIAIMAYPKSYGQPSTWVKMVTVNAIEKSSCKIWTAIQCFDNITAKSVFDQVKDTRIAKADGIAIFRYGTMTDEMWHEFHNGMNYKIDKDIDSQIQGIIYNGPGTAINSWVKSMDVMLQTENIIPILYHQRELQNMNIFKNKKFILMPGGGGGAQAEALGIKGLANVESFVKSGAGYIGICAGAYLAGKGYNNITEKFQIINSIPKDITHWNRGNGLVDLEIKKSHPIFKDITSKNFSLNYVSGPVLEPANLKLSKYIELAIFKTDISNNGATPGDMMNKSAIIESKYNKGTVLLFSPHPELTEGMESLLINAINYVSRTN